MNKWNVIFLLNKLPASKIVLLKRSPNKKFAPNFYTGVGGKVEPGETILDSAYRELKEETGIINVNLTEFAQAIIDADYSLHYFWGLYPSKDLPKSDDGDLCWVSIEDVVKRNIIPTTFEIINHWALQEFSTQSFTLLMKTLREENGIKFVEVTSSKKVLIL